MTPASESNGTKGERRAPDGRFLPGTKGGPGNPRARLMCRHLQAAARAVTPAEVEDVLRKLLDNVLTRGCTASASILLDRVLGRPKAPAVPVPLSGVLADDAAQLAQAAALGLLDVEVARGLLALAVDAETVASLAGLEGRSAALEARHGPR